MNYYKTPDEYPSSEIIRQADSSGTKYPQAYVQYDDNYLYIPTFTGRGVVYLKIDKHCIMDALEYWKSIKEPEDDDIQYFRHTTIIEAANIGFDNMIVKGVLALNNRKYKEEKEISDDE